LTALTRELPRSSRARLALLGLCLAGFAWRLSGLTFQSLWRDEVDSLRFAARPLDELLLTFSKPGENGPLFFLTMRPWLDVLGQSEFALRFPSVLAGVLVIPLTYVLARRLIALAAGHPIPSSDLTLANAPLIAAALVAANPYLTWYSQEGKMYAWLAVLTLGAHLAFVSAVIASQRRNFGWPRWLIYLALLALSVLTHILSILIVLVHALWLICLWPASRRSWLPFLLTLLAPAAPYFALAGWWQLRLFLTPDFQTGHPFVPLSGMANVLLVGFGHGIAAPLQPLLLSGVIFLLLAGLIVGVRGIGPGRWAAIRLAAMLLVWLAVPLLALYAISLRKPLFADRYLIWIMPGMAITVALGLRALSRTWRPLGWAALAALLAVSLLNGARQARVPVKADLRAAAAYVTAQRRPGDRLLFQMPYIRHTYEYYAGPQASWIDGPYTNNGNPPQQVADEMHRATQGAPAVWLIAAEERLWDERGLARTWLATHGRPSDAAQFTRVEVIRYELSPAAP
jgi:4-amino-4-deoxy-L-arabinose transferase-like glycosyltransferase